ncbi:MAG: DUF4417 domain-containing protein [Porphyromonadaceae bacterium]|nr:DUF4417 domain-containing protein [Porphyromonadaceae bacterium]
MRYTYAQRRMMEMYRLDVYRGMKAVGRIGRWGIPELPSDEQQTDFDGLVAYNEIRGKDLSRMGVHFFIDDYQFERLWNNPYKYRDELRGAGAVLTPDFSLYADMPLAEQIYNVFRNRVVGAFFWNLRMNVIPTVSWSDRRSYDFCFEGVEVGSVVAVSDNGCLATEEARRLWMEGFEEMKRRIRPKLILMYGSGRELEGEENIRYFKNGNIERLRGYGR